MDNQDLQKLTDILSKYAKDRPKPDRRWDQFTATDETTAKRAVYLKNQNALEGTRIAFLGDDDLTSIAVKSLGKEKISVTVFEIDERLLNLIKRISQKENLKVEVTKTDLLEETPRKYRNKFDVVFTDPPYTPAGISLFLNRSLEILRRSPNSKIYLCYGTGIRSEDREFKIQEIITQKGLLIEEKIKDFNTYRGVQTIGNKSSLFRLGLTPNAKATIYPGQRVYTNQ